MRKLIIPLIILALLTILGLAAYGWWIENTKSPLNGSFSKNFLITRGTSASLIGDKLYKEGFIKNPLAFKFYLQITGRSEKIQAGEYKLPSDLTLYELVDALLRGPAEIWVAIPEGLRREETVGRFIQTFGLEGADSENFREEFLSLTKESEGLLFPDTYLFAPSASPSLVVKRMLAIFDTKVDETIKGAAETKGYTLNQVITLASLVERETKTDGERPVVAGILLKRLNADWPLQVDATLQYGVANEKCRLPVTGWSASGGKIENCSWWTPLTKEDLEINSPYNSYKRTGLPPTPIASPGLSSIKAVVFPQETPYWFYLHDPSGQIHYARSLEEHNKNIVTYLNK